MTTPHITVAGQRGTTVRIQIPQIGPWVADVDLDTDTAVSGRVVLQVGTVAFSGTVDAAHSGIFALKRKVRIVAGAGAWGAVLPAKHWHNDAGVPASLVLRDTAASLGETIDTSAATQRVGTKWVRHGKDPASAVLRALAPAWHVRLDGTTVAGPRAAATPGKHELLDFDPRTGVAELAADNADAVLPGMTLSTRLDRPIVVRDVRVEVEVERSRVVVWGTPT